MATGVDGVGDYWALANHYNGSLDHPDVKAWPQMTDYQKGEAVRRMYVDMLRMHVDIAAGRMTPEQYAERRRISLRYDWDRVVGEAFGIEILHRYQAAKTDERQAPGYHAEELRSAAYAYMIAMQTIVALAI